MTRETIEVRIETDGSITAETHGIRGPRCLDYIAVLEDLLDAETTNSTLTADHARTGTDAELPNTTRIEDAP